MIKYTSLTALIFVLFFTACSNSNKEGYEIELKLNGEPPSEAYLGYYFNTSQYVADTTQIENGTFVFKGDENLEPGMYMIIMPPSNIYFDILIDNDQYFELETSTNALVDSLIIEDSEINTAFYEYIRFLTSKRTEFQQLQSRLRQAPESEQSAIEDKMVMVSNEISAKQDEIIKNYGDGLLATFVKASLPTDVPEPPQGLSEDEIEQFQFNYYKEHYFDNFDFSKSAILRTPFFAPKISTYFDNLVKRQADSLIAETEYLIELSSENTEVYKTVVISLVNRFANGVTNAEEAAYAHLGLEYYTDSLKTPWVGREDRLNIIARAQIIDSLQTLNIQSE